MADIQPPGDHSAPLLQPAGGPTTKTAMKKRPKRAKAKGLAKKNGRRGAAKVSSFWSGSTNLLKNDEEKTGGDDWTDEETDDDASETTDESDGETDGEKAGNDNGTGAKIRQSKSMPERAAAKGSRPGPKGRFQGGQRALLEQLLPKYEAVPKGKRGKNPHLQVFWKETGDIFWSTFTVDEVRAQMEPSYAKAAAKVIMTETNKSIRSWYRWRVRGGSTNNPWQAALTYLRRSADTTPRRMTTWQIMHSKQPERITELYEAQATDAEIEIVVRNRIARQLFEALSETEKAALEAEVDGQFAEQKLAYETGVEGLETPSHEDQLEARERLCSVIWPLLQLIAKFTGFQCLTLLGAAAPSDPAESLNVSVVNFGETEGVSPQDFRTFSGPAFNGVLGVFAQFVGAVAGLEPRVNENGLPMFDINIVHDKETEKGRVPKQVASNVVQAPPVEAADPKTVHTGDTLSTGSEHVGTEHALRVQPRAKAKSKGKTNAKGKEKEVGANNFEPALPRLSASALAGVPLSDFIHFSPNDPVQPPSLATSSIVSYNPEQITHSSSTNFNIDPVLLAENSQTIYPPSYSAHGTSLPFPPPTLYGIASAPSITALPIMATNTTLQIVPPRVQSPARATTVTLDAGAQQVLPPIPPTGAATSSPGCSGADVGDSSSSCELATTIAPQDIPNADDAPQLIQEQLTLFCQTLVPASVAKPWTELLQGWIEFERAGQFESKRLGLSSTSRPAAVSWWIKCARKGHIDVTKTSPEVYVSQWLAWWLRINPKWRDCEGDLLVIGGACRGG